MSVRLDDERMLSLCKDILLKKEISKSAFPSVPRRYVNTGLIVISVLVDVNLVRRQL